jgi:hypothetical protein
LKTNTQFHSSIFKLEEIEGKTAPALLTFMFPFLSLAELLFWPLIIPFPLVPFFSLAGLLECPFWVTSVPRASKFYLWIVPSVPFNQCCGTGAEPEP